MCVCTNPLTLLTLPYPSLSPCVAPIHFSFFLSYFFFLHPAALTLTPFFPSALAHSPIARCSTPAHQHPLARTLTLSHTHINNNKKLILSGSSLSLPLLLASLLSSTSLLSHLSWTWPILQTIASHSQSPTFLQSTTTTPTTSAPHIQ